MTGVRGGEAMARYRRADHVLWRRTPRGVVVMPVGAETVRVGSPGDAVWDLLDVGRTATELASLLAPRYGESAEGIRPDIEDLLTDLTDRGVLTRVD